MFRALKPRRAIRFSRRESWCLVLAFAIFLAPMRMLEVSYTWGFMRAATMNHD
jgi:hypothetical protein